MIRVALKGLLGRKFRSILTALAIVLGVAMVSGSYVLTDSVGKAFDTIFTRSYAATDAFISGKEAFKTDESRPPSFPAALLARVRALPQVAAAAGTVADTAQLIDRKGNSIGGGGPPTLAFGADPHERRFTPLTVSSGRWPVGPNEVAIDQGTARRKHFAVGDSIRVSARGPVRWFRIAGIVRFGGVSSIGGATIAVFDLPTAQRLFRKRGLLDSISVAAKRGTTPARLVAAIRPILPPHTQVRTGEAEAAKQSSDTRSGIDIFQKILLAFGGIALFVGAFIIFNSLSITVAQRAREFALVRTIGASRRQVLGSVVVEALAIGALASVVGLFLGLGIAKALNTLFASFGIDLPQAGLVFATRTVVASLLVGTVITLVAGLVPAIRATRVPPIAVLREGVGLPRSRLAPFAPYIALAVALAGFGLLAYGLFGRGLDITPRLVYLGTGALGVFVGIALFSPKLVPPLARVLGWPSARFGGAPGALARENAMRSPGRTAATAAALMIGLTLVTFVAVFAQGLRHSVEVAVKQQLRTDYIVTSKDGFTPIDPASTAALRRVPGVSATNVRGDRGRAFGVRINVTGLDPATVASGYRFHWTRGSDAVLPELARGGAVITEGFADKHHLRVGSRFRLESPQGRRLQLAVAGIYKPPALGNMLGSVNISVAAFDSAWESPRNIFTLVDAPAIDEATEAALDKALRRFPDQRVWTQPRFVEKQIAAITQTLNILYILLALSVIVSLFGIVNTLALSVFERTRELGMLRAIGTTRRQVRRLIRHEGVLVALIGATLGIALGIVLAALVTAALRREGIVFSVPVPSIVAFALIAVVAGVVAAALPARRAARLNVLEALQYE